MTAIARVLVSRFPGYVTPGALPILPELITIHDDLLTGRILVFRWFKTETGELEQSAPERFESFADAWLRAIPTDYTATVCPEDFARAAYRRRNI